MESGPEPGDQSLIIRFRREPRDLPGAPPTWRGEVTDVMSRERFVFARPEDLLQFLADRLGTGILRTALARWTGRPR